MLDEARHWAETQFGTADLGDARRPHRLVSIRAAIARAPDESLPRHLGSLAHTQAGYRLVDCGAVTREAVINPHVAQGHAQAARHPIVLRVHDDTIRDFAPHRTLKAAGRVGDDRGTGFFAHLESVRDAGWDAVVRAARERRLVQGGGLLTALRAARAMGASTILTKTGAAVVWVVWRELELLPPRTGPRGR